MSFIATNKVADYIAEHPEARVSLLLWLKQQAYIFRHMFDDQMSNFGVGAGQSTADPDYHISYIINYPAKALLITYVEIKQELQERTERELAKTKKSNPGTWTQVIEICEAIADETEPLVGEDVFVENPASGKTVTRTIENNLVEQGWVIPDFTGVILLESASEYKHALDRVTEIFKAQPGEPEYDELISLLPRIQQYEFQQLKFPALKPFEAVKHRLELFKMLPEHLHSFIDSNIARQFLAGEVELDDAVLQRIYQFLALRFTPDDGRFEG